VYVNELQAFADSTRLKVVTWNLGHNTAGTDTDQGNKLAAQGADVILTQETRSASHASTIASALGAGWEHRYYGTTSGDGVAIFYKTSRLTVVEEPELFDVGPSSYGGVREAIRVKLRVDGKTFNAFVTHLDWPEDGDWTDPTEEHVQNRDNFVNVLDQYSGPKIFGGDLNARYTGNSVQQATITTFDAYGVDSCFVRVTDPTLDTNAEKHTYCDQNFPTRTTRLDHIYATSDFIQVSHNLVLHDDLSDHKLVVAEFDIQ
jgi:endonuclease/exonuclease/phosphatase (EEP) superfamily protein YafD